MYFFTDRPQITDVLQRVYTVNETNNVSMACRADGVPQPTITWMKTGNSEILTHGEQLQIFNSSSGDDGTYTCIAKNYLGNDSREITLNVQSKLSNDNDIKHVHMPCYLIL